MVSRDVVSNEFEPIHKDAMKYNTYTAVALLSSYPIKILYRPYIIWRFGEVKTQVIIIKHATCNKVKHSHQIPAYLGTT